MFKMVRAALRKGPLGPVSQCCAERSLKCDSALPVTETSNCIDRNPNKNPVVYEPASAYYGELRFTACMGLVTNAVLFHDVAVFSKNNGTKPTKKDTVPI